jgi:hypothetical protein
MDLHPRGVERIDRSKVDNSTSHSCLDHLTGGTLRIEKHALQVHAQDPIPEGFLNVEGGRERDRFRRC